MIRIKVGSDLLQFKEFQNSFKRVPNKFERDIFCESELSNTELSHLAGIFAAKEAIIKALDLRPGSWKFIKIKNLKSGKPVIELTIDKKNIKSSDLSISHHGDYVMAVAAFLIDD